jgi:hypothetical protein
MLKVASLLVGIVMIVSCQKKSGGSTSPGGETVDTKQSDPQGTVDDGPEIAILALAADAGPCNQSKRGKTYYVLQSKKFQFCNDSDQWELVDLQGTAGSSGASGKNSLVSVVAESVGGNCAGGGQKIMSGLDANGNGQLDSGEVSSTGYSCNGSSGVSGAAGQMSLVTVTAESNGANCAAGGRKIQSGLDTNSNSVLDGGEVQSTSYVCNGLQGAVGATGAAGANGVSGKNALINNTTESAGGNCSTGGRKLEVGLDNDGNGSLSAGEVTATSFVCNGAIGSSGADGADGDKYVGRVMYTATGTRLGPIVKDFEYLNTTVQPTTSASWVTPARMLIVRDEASNRHVAYVADSVSNLTIGSSKVSFRTRNLEDLALYKLSTFDSAIVFSNTSCNSSGAFFAYQMTNSYKPNGSPSTRMFNNKTLHDYLTGLGLTIAYNRSATQDIVPNCATPASRTDLGSHDAYGSCETIFNTYDVGATQPATGSVCSVSFVSNVFPDGVTAGWYVQKNQQ